MKLITHANREHSGVAGRLLDQLRDIRQITERNAREVKETKGGATDLLRHAEELAGIVERAGRARVDQRPEWLERQRKGSNGRG